MNRTSVVIHSIDWVPTSTLMLAILLLKIKRKQPGYLNSRKNTWKKYVLVIPAYIFTNSLPVLVGEVEQGDEEVVVVGCLMLLSLLHFLDERQSFYLLLNDHDLGPNIRLKRGITPFISL